MSGYILVMVVGAATSGIAALWVRSSYSKYSKQPSASGLTGAQTARMIFDRSGLTNARVEPVPGRLTDHYDRGGREEEAGHFADRRRSLQKISSRVS